MPPPPIAELFGFQIVEAEEGRAVFALEPAEWMYNPIGMVHGGVAATMLDSCMGCAVHTTLAAGVGYTTTDVQVRYIRAMSDTSGRVLAEGRVVHAGRRTATAEGRLYVESDGKLIAHGATGCTILRLSAPSLPAQAARARLGRVRPAADLGEFRLARVEPHDRAVGHALDRKAASGRCERTARRG